MTPNGAGSRLSVLSDPRNDATSDAGAGTPSMLRRWPSKSNGVRRSAGVRMEGPNGTPPAPVSAPIGLGWRTNWAWPEYAWVRYTIHLQSRGRPAPERSESGWSSDRRLHRWAFGSASEIVGRPPRRQAFPPLPALPRSRSDHPPKAASPFVRRMAATKRWQPPRLGG